MEVSSVKFSSFAKAYRLKNGLIIDAHRFCCLGPGDDLVMHRKNKLFAKCINGHAIILPAYSAPDSIKIGARTICLVIKEPVSKEELSGYHKLEEYHYRGKVLHGRRVPLVIATNDPLLPNVLGYIELSTAFLMGRPRAVLFDHPFKDRTAKVSWQTWKKDTVRRYTNVVVRIARCVVSPEFRGLGLARLLVKHAISFARDHWHVAKLKPLFLEINADMLRYVPFVESAGMHYIGETEGNLVRVKKDMNYILANFERVKNGEILDERSAGIVDLQVHYATCLKKIEIEQGMSRDYLLELLMGSPQRLSDDNWALLHHIFRLPKPTFLIGLTPAAEKFIINRKRQLGLPDRYPATRPHNLNPKLSEQITIRDCSLHLDSSLVRTRNTRKVQHAFGVSREMLRTTLFSNLSFDINPGDLVLLCGPSGAGKTTLLSILRQRLVNPDKVPDGCRGAIDVPRNAKVCTLEPLRNLYPLVNSLGRVSFEHVLYALNVSGLAEAHLYVKRFKELSNGQRYRAMVAKLIASGANVWIADEFCATLDPVTANIVSKNLRRCANELGVTVILAAANWSEFIDELRPDTIVHLRSPWDYRIFSWDEFRHAIDGSQVLGKGIVNGRDLR
jgi:ABC-type transport system involved in cytochrome c biogenesis ATPase subunit/GNAT superfamily N-acetyltransferase